MTKLGDVTLNSLNREAFLFWLMQESFCVFAESGKILKQAIHTCMLSMGSIHQISEKPISQKRLQSKTTEKNIDPHIDMQSRFLLVRATDHWQSQLGALSACVALS